MKTLAVLVALGAIITPLLVSYIFGGWMAVYVSPEYTFNHIPDQSGKFAIVTGGNTGIGKVTVRELARKGAKVVLTSRSVSKGENAKKDICNVIGSACNNIEVQPLDLASLESVLHFTDTIKTMTDRIDILILNAGVMMCPYGETKDGYELQFGTNHLGHFFLVDQLMTELLESSARVVTVSSAAHQGSYPGGIRFDQLDNNNNYNLILAYGQSKLANILFAQELAERTKGSGMTSNAIHPGMVKTDLMRHVTDLVEYMGGDVMIQIKDWAMNMLAMDTDPGAYTQLYVATAPEMAKVTGKYYVPIALEGQPSSDTRNRTLQQELWRVSSDLVSRFMEPRLKAEEVALASKLESEAQSIARAKLQAEAAEKRRIEEERIQKQYEEEARSLAEQEAASKENSEEKIESSE